MRALTSRAQEWSPKMLGLRSELLKRQYIKCIVAACYAGPQLDIQRIKKNIHFNQVHFVIADMNVFYTWWVIFIKRLVI